jgi:RNA polymerase sigma-70 factor (sigma-E family)
LGEILGLGLHVRGLGCVISGVTFEQFAVTRLPGLLRYAVVLTGDRELAQDVVQEVLARAQVKWKQIGRSDSPDAYLRRMLVNEYLSWRRSWAARNVHSAGERLVELSDAQGSRRDLAQDVVEADDLWNRLAGLGRKQRAVLVLRYYEQLDDIAIANLLGCSPATVRSNASKALKTLRLAAEQSGQPVFTGHSPRIHVRETP